VEEEVEEEEEVADEVACCFPIGMTKVEVELVGGERARWSCCCFFEVVAADGAVLEVVEVEVEEVVEVVEVEALVPVPGLFLFLPLEPRPFQIAEEGGGTEVSVWKCGTLGSVLMTGSWIVC
jgi:hypothetical protein